MPTHFSTIGFTVDGPDAFTELTTRLASEAVATATRSGKYLSWSGGSGEQVWLQLNRSGELIGANPHYAGKSSMKVRVIARVERENDTPLDGSLQAWASPVSDGHGGEYPFVFDLPDLATHGSFDVPFVTDVQLAAFSHAVKFFDSIEAYEKGQADDNLRFASKSFIPSGMFLPDGPRQGPPEALAIFTGHVEEASVLTNSHSGARFYWALVETLGGSVDVVIDDSLLAAPPHAGGILSGQFWLSGRLLSPPKPKATWLGRLFGGPS